MARILLADDDATTRDLVKRALEADGHSVSVTQDGLEALEKLSIGTAFDVLVTDVHMPGMDGVTLAARATGLVPGMRVLLMSGFMDELAKSSSIKAAKVATISKPFSLEQIRAGVRGLLS